MRRWGRIPALVTTLAALLLATAPSASGFGFQSLSSSFADSGGEAPAILSAGSHPGSWTTSVSFETTGAPGEEQPEGALRSLRIELPAGLVGTAESLPKCGRVEFSADSCAGATLIGDFSFERAEGSPIDAPLYLLAPLPGSAAEFGFHFGNMPVLLGVSISLAYPHNLLVEIADIPSNAELTGATLRLDGRPGGLPFLLLPRSCSEPLTVRFAAAAWEAPRLWVPAEAPSPQTLAGCGSLSYHPQLRVTPTTAVAAAPSGLDVDLEAPDPNVASGLGRAAADTASVSLRLPPGMVLNPAVASGLRGCAPAELASERPDPGSVGGCPEAAKIGSASVTTPLFDRPIEGGIYVALTDDPDTGAAGAENPFDSLLALYLVLRNAERGILLELPIQVEADPASGRLTARLDRVPELPLSHLALRFDAGPHSPLVTPSGCGPHTIAYSLAPSSGTRPLEGEEAFATAFGCEARFEPELSAGTTSHAAGSSSPFVMELRNPGGGPNLSGLHLALPPGLAADLTAAAPCPEPAVATASCPPDSRLGYARVALGAGPEPLWVPAGSPADSGVYLAGPYEGAPFSLLVAVPGEAGPFDLGQVVLRAPIRIDPGTAQVSIELTGLPQIVDGVPLSYRAIRLVIDRRRFVRTSTDCDPAPIELKAYAEGGVIATAADRYQVADCAALGFRPRLTVRFSGQLARNGHPSVEVDLRPRRGEANLASASVDLPAGQLLDTRRIGALCARGLPLGRCPAASRLGRARIRSPLLPEPLRGPIFMRSPSGRYPDLLADLSGGGVRLLLHGRTASAPGGRLRIRLTRLPDLPIAKASIELEGGRRGIIVNSMGLCASSRHAFLQLHAHSGKRRYLRPRVRLGNRCRLPKGEGS